MAIDAAFRLADVPDDIATDVGHIMVRWARLEWQLAICLFGLFGFFDGDRCLAGYPPHGQRFIHIQDFAGRAHPITTSQFYFHHAPL